MSETGKKVREIRLRRGISQNRLAKSAGISQSALSAIESNVKNPSAVTVELLATALGVTTAELLGEDVDDNVISASERQLILTWRALNPQGREYIRQQLAIAYQLYAGESGAAADMAQ